jgi:hypothetical protein
MKAQPQSEEAKDLDFRATDGVIAVRNHRSCDGCEIEIRADDKALDVFNHRYAHAAARMPKLRAAA